MNKKGSNGLFRDRNKDKGLHWCPVEGVPEGNTQSTTWPDTNYLCNSHIVPWIEATCISSPNKWFLCFKVCRIPKPSSTLYMIDGAWGQSANLSIYRFTAMDSPTPRVKYRHQRTINMAFIDGHAENRPYKPVGPLNIAVHYDTSNNPIMW